MSIIDDELKAVLIPSSQQIAQWELMQVLTALLAYPQWFRGRAGVWWIDNVPALIALAKGRSGVDDMDRMTMMIHMLMYTLRCSIYFEYIPSDSNWADGISRRGKRDEWYQRHGFVTANIATFAGIFKLKFAVLVKIFQFL